MHESARNPSKKDEKLILALASGASKVQAAALAGMGLRTVFNRLNDPEFRAKVAEARREMTASASGRLAALAGKAAGVLGRLLDDQEATVRLRAAEAILEKMLKYKNTIEIEERLGELERRLPDGDRGSFTPARTGNGRH